MLKKLELSVGIFKKLVICQWKFVKELSAEKLAVVVETTNYNACYHNEIIKRKRDEATNAQVLL
jgi:hypothetical protein